METELINKNRQKNFPEVFTPHQIKTLESSFRNCNFYDYWHVKRNLILFLINYHLALRPKEAVCIKISEVDIRNKTITIAPTSNKLRRGRKMPLPELVLKDLIEFMGMKRPIYLSHSDYLFPCRQGEHVSRDQWTDLFKLKLRQTGIWKNPKRRSHGHYSLYTLRHTKATEVYIRTGDLMMVANLLGHTTLECTHVYIHLAMVQKGYFDKMREAMSLREEDNKFLELEDEPEEKKEDILNMIKSQSEQIKQLQEAMFEFMGIGKSKYKKRS